ISPRQRLDDVLSAIWDLPFAGTDCALPMLWAARYEVPVDTFVVYTDSETWAGHVHPYQALRAYRDRMGIPAKLVVVGMTASDFSIADPTDAGMLDVAGFDAAVPGLIADFSTAEVARA
ncbi:MAG: TROVE domain-containing protein, partial [Actinomycetia bacterium]|nr:TROVE domain-containing protein [Actinomycetes bacterium]